MTACGAKKNSEPKLAYKLYKSARIKAVYNRRSGCDMGILSAEYGLVRAHEVIEPYERLMDEKRAEELASSVSENLQSYDCIIFFKGGARKSYFSCINAACDKARKTLVTLGFANMGGINDLPKVIELAKQGKWTDIIKIENVNVYHS